MRVISAVAVLLALFVAQPSLQVAPGPPRPLRIIAFGAHPDDAELKASGVAALWAAAGHKVKFVAMTNGDVGHFEQAGGPLAKRRKAEVAECARILGIETEVLDIHDGELMPSLENRRTVARLIRDWQADIVLGHRPYDYHPDHRYTGVLMDDAAVVVVAPFFVPDTKPVARNPVFLYYSDNFQDPKPFTPSVVVGFDAVAEKKWQCIGAMPSQFGDKDSWQARTLANVPQDDAGRARLPARHRQEARHRRRRSVSRTAGRAVRRGARPEGPVRGSVPARAVRTPGAARRAEGDVPDPVGMSGQQHRSEPAILDRRTLRADHRRLAALLRPGMRVLDVGCGPGAITRGIAEAVGPDGSVVGVDRDPALIDRARAGAAAFPNLRFEVGDATSLVYDAAFDVVTAARTLQWIADTGRAIRRMAHAVAPGGWLVVLDYNHARNAWDPAPPAAFMAFYAQFLAWRAANGWDNEVADHLPALLEAAGLTGIEIHDADEVGERGDADFAQKTALWVGVIDTLGPTMCGAGVCDAALVAAAREAYDAWRASTLQRQTLSMKTVIARIGREA